MSRLMLHLLLVAVLLGVGVSVVPAEAQRELEVTLPTTAQPPAPELAIRREPSEATRSREQEFYPDDIRSRHDPVFIAPLSTTIQTGPKTAVRVGFAGWISPAGRGNLQVHREVAGGVLSFGLGVAWDVPIQEEPAVKPAPPAKSPR